MQKNDYGNGDSSGGGSSAASNGHRGGGGGAKYQDETKLYTAIKLYTTLVDNNEEESDDIQYTGSAGKGAGGPGQQRGSKGFSNRNFLLRIEKKILKKLFQINHVVLTQQAVTVPLFHLILLLTFIQILFNIFYKVDIVNEFWEPPAVQNVSTSLLVQNQTAQQILNSTATLASVSQKTFRVDEFFNFINFQFYVMKGNSDQPYIMLYSLLSGLFLLFLIILFSISGRVFELSKAEEVKEGTKLMLRVISILMCLYIYIFQIPLVTLLLQGFLCDEDPNEALVLTSIKCNSLQHQLLCVASSLILVLYLTFLFFQQMLYSSNSFEQIVPWGSFERTLSSIRVLIKLTISAVFIFDKKGALRGQVNLVCFFLQAFMVAKRYQRAIIFNTSVFYATVAYEAVSMWLYITVSIHILTDTPVTIFSFTLLVVSGLIFGVILLLVQVKKSSEFIYANQTQKFTQPIDFMIYFYRLYQLIESGQPHDQIILQGKLRHHMQSCETLGCPCVKLIESIDKVKKYREIKIQQEEEDQQQMLMTRAENDIIASGELSNSKPIFNQMETSTITIEKPGTNPKTTRINNDLKKAASMRPVPGAPGNNDGSVKNWLQYKRKMQKIEEKFNKVSEEPQDMKSIKKKWYRLMSIYIRDAIEKFPKNVDLKIINAYIQKAKVNNEFKAIFEMMNCELCQPSIYEQFIIFRKKIEVEQSLVKQHAKNIQKIGVIDVVNVFNYEKYFQKYQLYEYLTTFSALCFWNELLAKQIDASVLQIKGSEISQYYETIQEVAKKLQSIYPDEIKFLFRYGNFLLHIIHNEYDALENFSQAQSIFQSKMTKKGKSMPVNEQTIFGENSSSAIIVISATSTRIGTIIHANEEVENILGYKRRELIGKNITIIIPRPIAKVHDRLIQRYFETAKPTVIEIKRQLFGADKEGYLKEVQLIVKVYPQVNEKIVFVGFIQRHDRFDDMEPPKMEYEKLEKQYIITDGDGNITNVTEGLNSDLGLHAKFFHYTDSIFQQMFNIQKICSEIQDQENQEALETEGTILTFDTRNILQNIELESLSADDIIEVRSNLGQYQAYVQLKRLVIHPQYCTIHIYRVVLLSKYSNDGNFRSWHQRGIPSENQIQDFSKVELASPSDTDEEMGNLSRESFGSAAFKNGLPSVSMSSTSSTQFSFNKVVKDFKKALGDRKVPKNLLYLNRIMILFFVATIALSGVDFFYMNQQIDAMGSECQHFLNGEQRTLKIVQLASNVRSYINIANGLEFENYDGIRIQYIDRFEHLGRLIDSQAEDLQKIHTYMTKQRENQDASDNKEQSQLEYQPITLFRLDNNNNVNPYQQPYRVAFLTFLNGIQSLNMTEKGQLQLPKNLIIQAPGSGQAPFKASNTTNLLQKIAYFLMVNGLRSLRTKSEEISIYQSSATTKNLSQVPFLIVIILGLLIIGLSIILTVYQIWSIENNKAEILSLYAMLSMKEIQEVYEVCDQFMNNLNEGSLKAALRSGNAEDEESDLMQKSLAIEAQKDLSFPSKRKDGQDLSEEEKDEEFQVKYIEKKRANRSKKSGRSGGRSKDVYAQMIKRTFSTMRNIQKVQDEQMQQQKHHRAKSSSISAGASANLQQNDIFREDGAGDENNHHKKKKNRKTNLNSSQPSQNKKGQSKRQRKNQDNKKKEINQDEEDSVGRADGSKSQNSSNSDDEPSIHQKTSQTSRKNQLLQNEISGDKSNYMTSEEVEQRRKFFFQSIQNKNWGKVILTTVIGFVFAAYFISLFIFQNEFKNELEFLEKAVPSFFDRFRNPMLAFAFLREKIINNNSLSTFESDARYGNNLPSLYIDRSMEVQQQMNELKISHSYILNNLVNLLATTDTESYCKVIQSVDGTKYESKGVVIGNFSAVEIESNRPYEFQATNLSQVFQAAQQGDVGALKKLKIQGIDLNERNYDRRTALHDAVKGGSLETVKYLISQGLSLNSVDRWGATPLSYALPFPEIQKFLKSLNASEGTADQGEYLALASVYESNNLTTNDLRTIYASYYGNITALAILKAQGVLNVEAADRDGRTPLSVAASEGNIDAVKYLVSNKANIAIRDARKNNALADAKREQRTAVVDYIKAITSNTIIQDFCSDFQDGLLRKGFQTAMGSFHKNFADLNIKVNSTKNYDLLLTLLNPPLRSRQKLITGGSPQFNLTTLQSFFETQELYFSPTIEKFAQSFTESYTAFVSTSISVNQIVFFVFLVFQIIILFVLRARLIENMKEDIFKQRGILNLIPDNFFEQNRFKVEKLIARLQN